MAFAKDDAGNFAVDDAGNYGVDDGATITTYMPPSWESPSDPTVTIEAEPDEVIELTAVGNSGTIVWTLEGPDAASFDIDDNGDGTAELTCPGSGVYEVDIVATNDAGEDTRTLLVEIPIAATSGTSLATNRIGMRKFGFGL